MKKCGKVKNPCKICFQTVTAKNGLRCIGACQKWAHFKCLNYTPGKIRDIKAGLIKVNCPCPDCHVEPKEEYTQKPFVCGKEKCPANLPLKCEASTCPSNNPCNTTQTEVENYDCPSDCPSIPSIGRKKKKEVPTCPPKDLCSPDPCPPEPCPRPPLPQCPPHPCPNTPPQPKTQRQPFLPSPPHTRKLREPGPPCPPGCRNSSPKLCPTSPPRSRPSSPPRIKTEHSPQDCCVKKKSSPSPPKVERMDKKCCDNLPNLPPINTNCKKCSQLPLLGSPERSRLGQVKIEQDVIKSRSCCGVLPQYTQYSKGDMVCTSTSDSEVRSSNNRSKLSCKIDQICTTIEEFSDQFKDLMCKMRTALEKCQ